jgi:4-diphosphocytidyl-2-C-methyl-D-erythritol kinase
MLPYTFLSPAKLNLFLRIIKKLDDGYHQLQSIMQLIGLYDVLQFEVTPTNNIVIKSNVGEIANENNLIYKAARALQQMSKSVCGATIYLHKNIPMQAGLGGGSSNAATTLLALNKLWKLNVNKDTLAGVAKTLGADVPFFIYQQNAVVGGIGEKILQYINLPKCYYLIVKPSFSISTEIIFRSKHLTFKPELDVQSILNSEPKNDCLRVVLKEYPAMQDLLESVSGIADFHLTGTGSCIFTQCKSYVEALSIQKQLPILQTYIAANITG